MREQFTISTVLNKSAQQVYNAWLDSELHAAFTGGAATIANEINSDFTAWDDYISGKIVGLELGKRILHTWRTAEFDDAAEDSSLEVLFEDTENGQCNITINHSNLPDGGAKKYSMGWEANYFEPMRAYFND